MSDMYCDDGRDTLIVDSVSHYSTYKIESKEYDSMIKLSEDSTYTAFGTHREHYTLTYANGFNSMYDYLRPERVVPNGTWSMKDKKLTFNNGVEVIVFDIIELTDIKLQIKIVLKEATVGGGNYDHRSQGTYFYTYTK
jgi:hypothetical protein